MSRRHRHPLHPHGAPECGPHHHHGPMDPHHGPMGQHWAWHAERWKLRRFVGARLHRQLLVWFCLGIVATMGAATMTWRAMGDNGASVAERRERVLGLLSDQLALRWDDPAARDALAHNVAVRLQVGVELRSAAGVVLARHEMPTRCAWSEHYPVGGRGALRRGDVSVCLERWAPGGLRRTAWALGAAVLVLWLLAGKIARRLTRPLRELTDVAQELGRGRLDRRARLRHGQPGEVGELTLAINEMAERIERQLRDQKELLAAVSHEMRSPLTRIRLLLELGREGDAVATFDSIEGEVLEMDRLVGDLLARARLDFSVLQPQRLELVAVVRGALERTGLPGAVIEAVSGPLWVQGDATLLGRAVGALLDNARKYGAAPVRIVVEKREAGRVRVCVRDGGEGFPEGASEQWFEPFRRGHRDGGGLGLGLALVRRIAEAHGGSAGIEPGPGGCVWLEVSEQGPAAPAPEEKQRNSFL